MSSRPRTLRASMRRLSVMADKRKPPAFTGQRVYSDSVNVSVCAIIEALENGNDLVWLLSTFYAVISSCFKSLGYV